MQTCLGIPMRDTALKRARQISSVEAPCNELYFFVLAVSGLETDMQRAFAAGTAESLQSALYTVE